MNERGQVGGIEAIAFGVLVLVLGVLIIGNAWGVIDARIAAGEAAREAARTFATAPAATDAQADALAQDAGTEALRQFGWTRPGITIHRTSGSFTRCALITYEVTIPVPAIRLPWVASGLSLFHARATDSERVDPYRSGVPGPGAADCSTPGP